MSKLFGSLTYESTEEYSKFLSDIDQPKAVAMLVAAAAYAQSKGVFSLVESEVIINSIRKLLPVSQMEQALKITPAGEGIEHGPSN